MLWLPDHFTEDISKKIKGEIIRAQKDMQHIGSMYKAVLFSNERYPALCFSTFFHDFATTQD